MATVTIGEYTTSGATVNAALVSGLNQPIGLAVSGGNLFVTSYGNMRIGKYDANSGAVVNAALVAGLNQPQHIAVSGGNLFVAEYGNNRIGEYTTSGATVNAALVSGLNHPTGIAVAGGNLFVTNFDIGTIGEYTTSGATVNAALVSGLSQPAGIAVPLLLTAAVSHKTHGSVRTFDVDLPLEGPRGIECRNGGGGGNHTLVFSFNYDVVGGSASVSAGTGSVSGTTFFDNHMIVDLTGVANAQYVTVTLSNITDPTGDSITAPVSATMGVLLGDTSGNGSVNASDVSLTKLKSGQAVDSSNFRSDVTVSGSINASDVSSVKLKSGTALPP